MKIFRKMVAENNIILSIILCFHAQYGRMSYTVILRKIQGSTFL